MIGRTRRWGVVLLLACLAWPAVGAAQPPDLRQMAGRPLPVSDLPVGTVSVRVARQMPANAVANVEVTALISGPGSAPQPQKATTGTDGRAVFTGVPSGATFVANAVVEGETLTSQSFPVPDAGGVRIMLISGLGQASTDPGAQPAQPGAASRFAFSITVAAPVPAADLPAGVLQVRVVNEAGAPVADHRVNLGQAGTEGQVRAFDQQTDAGGVATFTELSTAQDLGYLLVTEIDGTRIGSRPFRMPADTGMRLARMAPPARTKDTSVLSFDQSSRLIFEVREDFLFVGEVLSFRNGSDRLFDAGPGGVFVPLPAEMTSFQAFNDSARIEEVKGKGLSMLSSVPPTGPRDRGVQARFAFLLPTYGDDSLEFEQELPFSMQTPLLIVPDVYNLTVTGEGLKTLPKEKDSQGNAVSLFELPTIPAGGTIKLKFEGLPKVDRTGHLIVIVVCSLLVIWGIWGAVAVKRADNSKTDRKRQDLRNRREKLFDELVALEEKRRNGTDIDTVRRAQLLSQLEAVYRDLQALDRRV